MAQPAAGMAPAAGIAPADFAHVVRPGDTLWDIAGTWGTHPDILAAQNGLDNPHLIHPGQVIRHSR
jgi:lysozyme